MLIQYFGSKLGFTTCLPHNEPCARSLLSDGYDVPKEIEKKCCRSDLLCQCVRSSFPMVAGDSVGALGACPSSTESAPPAMLRKPDLSCLPTSRWDQCRNLLSAVASSSGQQQGTVGLDASLGQCDAMPCNRSRQKVPVTQRAWSQLQRQRLSEGHPRLLGGCKRPTARQQALPAVPGHRPLGTSCVSRWSCSAAVLRASPRVLL